MNAEVSVHDLVRNTQHLLAGIEINHKKKKLRQYNPS
jgi:hypothetical protein